MRTSPRSFERRPAPPCSRRPLVAPHSARSSTTSTTRSRRTPDARAAIKGGAAGSAPRAVAADLDRRALFKGPHDDAYFERRARIGCVHVRCPPQMYMLTAMDQESACWSAVTARTPPALNPARPRRMLTALHQLLDIELAIMLGDVSRRSPGQEPHRRAARDLGQFAAGIGHELSRPAGRGRELRPSGDAAPGALAVADVSVARHMDKIAAEVRRSSATISDLLELARSRPPNRRVVDCLAFVAEAGARRSTPAADDGGLEPVPRGLPLDADPDQLTRVLTNLLINASQHANGTRGIWIDAAREGAVTILRVRATARGVPANLREPALEGLCPRPRPRGAASAWRCAAESPRRTGLRPLEPSERGAIFLRLDSRLVIRLIRASRGGAKAEGHCSPRRRERFCCGLGSPPGSRTRRARRTVLRRGRCGATSSTTSVSPPAASSRSVHSASTTACRKRRRTGAQWRGMPPPLGARGGPGAAGPPPRRSPRDQQDVARLRGNGAIQDGVAGGPATWSATTTSGRAGQPRDGPRPQNRH